MLAEVATVFGGFIGGGGAGLAIYVWLRDRHIGKKPFQLKSAIYTQSHHSTNGPLIRLLVENRSDKSLNIQRAALMTKLYYETNDMNDEVSHIKARSYTNELGCSLERDTELRQKESMYIDFRLVSLASANDVLSKTGALMLVTSIGAFYINITNIASFTMEPYTVRYSAVSYTWYGALWERVRHTIWRKWCPSEKKLAYRKMDI